MSRDRPAWDYVFVSDLHLSLGYSQDRRAYHPREDFFFDDVFFRWLRWLDAQCADDRRWELVFAGDALDFLPVDERTVSEYVRERDRRQDTLDLADRTQVVRYWERQFSTPSLDERVPKAVQRLIFEDDILDGHIQLEPRSREGASARGTRDVRVPAWALQLYARYLPGALEGAAAERGEWLLRAPPKSDSTAPGIARDAGPGKDQAAQRPSLRAASREDEKGFEQRYGFLPTPEKSAQKLAAIYRGHRVFFRALAWFTGLGHRIVFLRGNHDLELYWPSVQERFRAFVAHEYAAAFEQATGYGAGEPTLSQLEERIIFRPGWFYYRPGAFYVEHGCQYEMISGSANPIRPLMPGNPWLLNPDVGSLGVTCFHNHLESQFPELENEANYGTSLLGLARRDPFRILGMIVRHATDFVRMAQRLWLAGQTGPDGQEPGAGDVTHYAGMAGVEPAVVQGVYDAGAKPLLLRERLAWLLFSPQGHVIKLLGLLALAAIAAGLLALWYLVLTPALAGLLPGGLFASAVGPSLRLLAQITLWLVPPAAYAWLKRRLHGQETDDPLFGAAICIHRLLRGEDPGLRYVIMGHNHQPNVRPVALRADGRHIYYLNTGTWTPTFAEGKRRLQTLGREVQFTFLRLVQGARGYEADLLRWNDSAGRAEPQMVPPDVA